MKFNSIIRIYSKIPSVKSNSLVEALRLFNDLKNNVTAISPTANGITYNFDMIQSSQFRSDLEEVKIKLVEVLV